MGSRSSHLLFILVFLGLAISPSAEACSCTPGTVQSAVERADYVFEGKLIKVEFIDRPTALRRFRATLQVVKVWKGALGSTVVLLAREAGADCIGFSTEVGQERLVFANVGVVPAKQPNVWVFPDWSDKLAVGRKFISPGVCTYNDEIKHATKTLQELGPPLRRNLK